MTMTMTLHLFQPAGCQDPSPPKPLPNDVEEQSKACIRLVSILPQNLLLHFLDMSQGKDVDKGDRTITDSVQLAALLYPAG